MKICFVSHSAERHGAELALLEIIDVVRGAGMECLVVLPSEGILCEELAKRNVPFEILEYDWWLSPGKRVDRRLGSAIRNAKAAVRLSSLITRHQCDVVYTNTIAIPVGAIAATLSRKPHVWHIHEFGTLDHGLKFDWGTNLSLSVVGKLSDVCITNSLSVKRHFSQWIEGQKLRLVYYSMKLSSHRQNNNAPAKTAISNGGYPFRCVLVGRIVKGKGQEDAILAVGDLAKIKVPVELILVGNGDLEFINYLKSEVSTLGLADRVVFSGMVKDPTGIVSEADAVLMCSKCEAFGRVTIEGMLAGKPVIGARAGATPELVKEGLNGLLYNPGDHRELGRQIKFLYENPSKACEMGQYGRSWAESFFSENRLKNELLENLNNITSR